MRNSGSSHRVDLGSLFRRNPRLIRKAAGRGARLGVLETLEPRLYLAAPAAPAITGFSTDSGVVGDRITNDNTLTVSGTADASNTVNVLFNGASQGTTTAGTGGTWSFAAAAKADGIYSVTATARDSSGNTSAPSGAFAIRIDATAPNAPAITGFSTDSGVVGDQITSDTTLTITGSAEAASAVTVFFGGASQGTTATAANGTWSLNVLQKPEGTHSITASAADVAGNVSGSSTAFDVTIDTTAPAAPAILGFSSDSGVVGDAITNDNTPTFTGAAEPDSSVTVFLNGVSYGNTSASSDGSWTFTAAPLDGTYNITATAQDAAGNTGPVSAPFTLTIDTVAPAAPIVANFSTDTGAVGDHITSDTTLTASGTAEAGAKITVFLDNVNQGSTTAAADGSWSLDLTSKPNGTHDITATAQDVAGNTSAVSSALAVTIDSTAPAAPTITAFTNDTGIAGDRITADNSLTVTGAAEPSSTVTVFFNGASQGTTDAGAGGLWSFDAAQNSDGVYSITATATDAAGNSSPASGPLVVTIDSSSPAAPTITGFSTDTGIVGDRITSDNTLTVTGTAEPSSTVTVFFNGTSQGATTTAANGTWLFNAVQNPDGVYAITASAQDAAGNSGPASVPLSVTIDSAAPATPTITGFSSDTGTLGDRITSDSTLAVTGTAEAGSTVSVYFNNVIQGTAIAAANSTWSFDAVAKPDGVYSITATATDAAGNTSGASSPLAVTIDTAGPAAPTITGFTADTGTLGDRITADNTLAVTGTSEPASTVTVFFGGASQGTTVTAADGSWTFDAAQKPDGVYSITATATEAAGNTSGASGPLVVTIDTNAPAAPTITGFSADTGTLGDRVTSDNTLTVAGTAEPGSSVTVLFDGTSQGATTTAANGTWSLNAAQKPDGVYAITATATDAAGNTSPASGPLVVTIDSAAPAAPAITGFSTDSGVIGDRVTNDATLTITGTAEAGSTVTVLFNAANQGTTTAAANGTWTFDATSKPDGVYTITAGASDAAGNTSPASGPVVVTIDSAAPAALSITGFSADSGVAGDRITNDNTLAVTGTAEAGSTVTVLFNGANQGTTTAAANGTWTFDATSKPDGVYSITATASDRAGNTSPASGPLVVTIDSTAPAAPSITGFSADSGVAGDRITNDNTLTVTGTAEAGSTVTVFFNAANQGTTTAAANGTWTLDATSKPDGVYTITATAGDTAGNISAASAPLVVTIDSTAPAAPTITGFTTDSAVVGDRITNDTTLIATGTAEPGMVVTIAFNVTSQGTTTADEGGNWSFAAAAKPDGVYSITATGADVAGNVSPASSLLVVTIDSTAPAAPTITGFTTDTGVVGDRTTADNTLTVTGTAEAGSTVTVLFNATNQGTTTAAANGTWTFNATSKPDGVYTITATASDAAGNSSPASNPLVVTVDTSATTMPTITSVSDDTGTSGDKITRDSSLTIEGTAEAGSTVTIFFNGASQGTTTAGASGTWTFRAPERPDGAYVITANFKDAAGNTSPTAEPCTITIDTVAPAPPVITGFAIDSGSLGDRVTNDTTPTITGTAEPSSTVSVLFGGTPEDTTTTNANGQWTYTTTPKPDGVQTITAKATDAAGNTSGASAPLAITIDTTPPAAPTITGFSNDTGTAGDRITSDNTVTVNGIADPGSTVAVFLDGTAQGTTTALNGAWTFAAAQKPDGMYAITATATDAAANASPASGPLTVTIDTLAPPIPFATVNAGPVRQGAAEPGSMVTAYVNGEPRGTAVAGPDGGFSITITGPLNATDTVTFDAQDAAVNRSPETAPALDSGGTCGSPSEDTNFNPITGSGTSNKVLMVRERAYDLSPDLQLYGAAGRHTFVQSLMFHTRDDEKDTEAAAFTVTFSPGTVILTTITSARLLGGPKFDSRATFSDAVFGIFDPAVRSADWNKYAGKPRGLESAQRAFQVVNDGRNGQPAVMAVEFPTRVGPDQGRIIVDYGDCWSENSDVTVEFRAPSAPASYRRYDALITPTQDLSGTSRVAIPLSVQPTTITQLADDDGSSATDHVTSDDTPTIFGESRPGATVRLLLDGNLVDSVLANGQGRWSYLFDHLEPGNYKLRAAGEFGGVEIGSSQLFCFVINVLPSNV